MKLIGHKEIVEIQLDSAAMLDWGAREVSEPVPFEWMGEVVMSKKNDQDEQDSVFRLVEDCILAENVSLRSTVRWLRPKQTRLVVLDILLVTGCVSVREGRVQG